MLVVINSLLIDRFKLLWLYPRNLSEKKNYDKIHLLSGFCCKMFFGYRLVHNSGDTEAYSVPCQMSQMDFFAKILNYPQQLSSLEKSAYNIFDRVLNTPPDISMFFMQG